MDPGVHRGLYHPRVDRLPLNIRIQGDKIMSWLPWQEDSIEAMEAFLAGRKYRRDHGPTPNVVWNGNSPSAKDLDLGYGQNERFEWELGWVYEHERSLRTGQSDHQEVQKIQTALENGLKAVNLELLTSEFKSNYGFHTVILRIKTKGQREVEIRVTACLYSSCWLLSMRNGDLVAEATDPDLDAAILGCLRDESLERTLL